MSEASRTVVYVSCSQGQAIEVLSLDRSSGALGRVETVRLSGDGMPLAASPDGLYLHAAVYARMGKEAEPLYESFRIDQGSGALTRIGTIKAPGRMSFIGVDRSGKHLLGASVANDLISSHRISAQGKPTEVPTVLKTVPSKAHQITTDRSNRFAFVPNLGAGLVQQFRFDPATGELVENDPVAFELHGDSGPRHMAHHPNGLIAYLLCEFDGALIVCAIDEKTGTLEAIQKSNFLPRGFSETPWGAQIHVTPDGCWLFTSDRASSTIGVHRIAPETGFIEKLDNWTTEACPRGFDIDDSGRWLIAAGEKSNRVTTYAIDPETGGLEARSSLDIGTAPIWVETLKARR